MLWYNLTSRNQAPIESIAIAASTRARCFDLITICFEFLSLVSLPKVGPLSRYSVPARSALELQQWSANPFLTHRLRKSFCSGSCLRRSPLPTPTSSPTFLTMTNRPWLGSPTSSIFYTYAELFMILVNLFYSGDWIVADGLHKLDRSIFYWKSIIEMKIMKIYSIWKGTVTIRHVSIRPFSICSDSLFIPRS